MAYSPTDEEGFVQPEISHRLSDKLNVALGANIFAAAHETTFFGQTSVSI